MNKYLPCIHGIYIHTATVVYQVCTIQNELLCHVHLRSRKIQQGDIQVQG